MLIHHDRDGDVNKNSSSKVARRQRRKAYPSMVPSLSLHLLGSQPTGKPPMLDSRQVFLSYPTSWKFPRTTQKWLYKSPRHVSNSIKLNRLKSYKMIFINIMDIQRQLMTGNP